MTPIIDIKDNNRARKLEATRKLQQLMHMAESRDFEGHVEIQIYAKGGALGRFEAGMREYIQR